MTIGLTEEHRALRDSVRGWAARHVTRAEVRAAFDAERERTPAWWRPLAEQGLLGLHLPEACGGSGYGLVELAVVLEELGRASAPGPFLPTVLASAVLHEAGRGDLLPPLADGSRTAALALGPGTLTLTRRPGGRAVLAGESAPVLGGHVADLVVLPFHEEGQPGWAVAPRAALAADDLASHDATRRLSRFRAEDLVLEEPDVLGVLAPRRPYDLAAALFAAEASGLADLSTSVAAEHARVRTQFGRPIGQFQGVKHRCARMLARAEQARACAWDAARALTPGSGADAQEAGLAAATAAATAVDAAFTTAKDAVQTLGGIGFTWEHDAHLVLRRAHTLRLLLGPAAGWHRRIAALALEGARRDLGVELPAEAAPMREEVRRTLAPARKLPEAERRTYLADHGFTAPHLPKPWGRGADPVAQLVIAEELQAAGLRPVDLVIGAWVAPTLVAHGTDGQRNRFLPPTLRGEVTWCQLFSEPDAGSDLASLTTKAERVPGGWRLTGQKVWTSMAREADWGICLARTEPEAPKHSGISYFLLDMARPGLDVRPLREITGDALFNEVFLDGVFVPDDCLVGKAGDGWRLARTTLANERVSLSSGSSLGAAEETLLRLARDERDSDPSRTETLGRLLAAAHSCALLRLRSTLRSLAGEQPGAESSIAKLLGVEHLQEAWETAVEWRGTDALCGPRQPRDATWWFLNSRCMSIAGGTTEVQLNIVGERLLGLPRDPEPAAALRS